MTARDELFRRIAGAFISEDCANGLLDAYRAEVLREAAELGRAWSREGYSAQEIATRLDREADATTPTSKEQR